jgi:hypothetical protein
MHLDQLLVRGIAAGLAGEGFHGTLWISTTA